METGAQEKGYATKKGDNGTLTQKNVGDFGALAAPHLPEAAEFVYFSKPEEKETWL